MNHAFWEGWHATIDGRPTTILRADALVRAVVWPTGRHVLAMRYAPREVTLGMAVTSVGCLLLAGIAALAWRRRRCDALPQTSKRAPDRTAENAGGASTVAGSTGSP